MNEILHQVPAGEDVLTLRPGPGDGSPEISRGDVFFYVAPDDRVPAGQPFATLTTTGYPGEPDAGLDRPGSYRVNVAEGRRGAPDAEDGAGPGTPDQVVPHPTYGEPGGWPSPDPGERTRVQLLALLQAAHARALARRQRRHDEDRTSG